VSKETLEHKVGVFLSFDLESSLSHSPIWIGGGEEDDDPPPLSHLQFLLPLPFVLFYLSLSR